MQKKTFLSKVLQMSATMIFFNISDICYSIYMSRMLGADGVGLFHLVMNVFSMGVSFSVSGMTLTSTRLLSDMPKDKAILRANAILSKCITLCLVTSGTAGTVIFVFSDFLAQHILRSPGCAPALRILAPALLCIGVSAPLTGYFTAFGKVGAIGMGKFFSHLVLWTSTLFLAGNGDGAVELGGAVTALVLSCIAETLCGIMIWKGAKLPDRPAKDTVGYGKILGLCAPLAIGSFLRTGLTSGENLLIPHLTTGDGLSSYGILKGMTMPVVLFPYVFMGAFTSLIVPEIARRYTSGHKNSIRYISALTVESTLTFAALMSAIFLGWHGEICSYFFDFPKSGEYLMLLSFMPLFMFFDSAVDAILKGLDQQVFSLKVNIADSMMRIVLICLVVPRFGIEGYIAVMYISEILNLLLSFGKLKKMTNVKVNLLKLGTKIPAGLVIASGAVCFVPGNRTIVKIIVFSAVYMLVSRGFEKWVK